MIMRASRSAGEAEFGSWLSPERLEERTQQCGAIGTVVYEAGRLQALLTELIVQINAPSSKIWMLPDRSFADLAELARALVEQLIASGREKRYILAVIEDARLAHAARDQLAGTSWVKNEENVDKLINSTNEGQPDLEFIAPYSCSEAEDLAQRLRTVSRRLYHFTRLRRIRSRAIFLPYHMHRGG
jgi:hypothetical protein